MHIVLVCIYASLRRVQLHLVGNLPLGSCRQQQDLPLSGLKAQTPQFFQHLLLHPIHQPRDFLRDFLVLLAPVHCHFSYAEEPKYGHSTPNVVTLMLRGMRGLQPLSSC